MAPENNLTPATGSDGAFTAEVATDPSLNTTVITLSYTNPGDASRNITVCLAPNLGCNMFRFRVGEHDLVHCDQDLLLQKAFTGCFVLWPFPNRMRDKRYVFQGQSYSLAGLKRPIPDNNLVHGLVFDRAWQFDAPRTAADAVSVTAYVDMTPESPFFDGYPFESRLSLTYTLKENGITIAYTVKNNGEKDLPYGFALHPYFSLAADKNDISVSLPADALMEADAALLPTGRILHFDGIMYAMYDLRKPTPVSHLNLDHVYTGVNSQQSATLHLRPHRLTLHARTSEEFTHIVIYVPPGEPFMCVENQTCSTDAPNLAARGLEDIAHLLEVHPGESATGYIEYSVEHEQ